MNDQDTVEVEATPIDEATSGAVALTAVERAAIDSQVATAKQYPRTVSRCIEEAMTLATMDEDTAASCFYSLPRGGKRIEGPSARLAEIMAYSWGNFRADADVVDEDRSHITAVGTAFDVEKNVAIRVRVRRRITKKDGSRYDDDMIGVAGNAAISIALRNAVFKVIPQSIVNRVYHAARRASIGKAGTITQKRAKAMEWFAKMGVSDAQVFGVLEVRGLDDIGEEQLITLRGMVTALKDGDSTVEQMFRKHDVSDGARELNEELGKKPHEQAQAEERQPGKTTLPDEGYGVPEERPDPTPPRSTGTGTSDTSAEARSATSSGPRDKRQKDALVDQCETHLDMMGVPKDSWLAAARELVTVSEKAASLRGLSVDALQELERKLAAEVGGG